MKTTYYLVLAAVVAAAGVTVYARLPDREPPAPSVPLAADDFAARRLELPPVALPPDDTPPDPMLIAPRGANLPLPIPVPPPSAPELPPVAPTAGALPPLPLPTLPVAPPVPAIPAVPELPKVAAPLAPPAAPEAPALPKVELPALPVPPVPAVPPAPPALPVAPKADAVPLPPLPMPAKPDASLPALPALPKPEAPVLPPAPKPETVVPPAVQPMPAVPPAPTPPANLLPPVTPAPLPPAPKLELPLAKPELPVVKPEAPMLPPAPKPDAPLQPLVKSEPLAPLPPPASGIQVFGRPPILKPERPAGQPVSERQPPPAPSAPTASVDPKPQPLPPPAPVTPVPVPAPGTKFVLLKGDRLLECSSATPNGDVWVVRQGALDRALAKGEVQFVGDSRDAIYKHVLGRVKADDAGARLQVARWCMYVGMREQALTEAREVQKLDAKNATAADMVRSLELSLKQFPPANQAQMAAPPQPVYPVDLRPAVPPMAVPVAPVVPQPVAPPIPPATEPDVDVPATAARAFPGLAMAVLQQKCAECHARADYAGSFKLARVDLENPSERAVRTNLRASAAQLSKDGPHPLLEKARTAHGGMKQAALSHLDASYKSLTAWAASAQDAPVRAIPPAAVAPAASAQPGVPQLLPPALPPAVPVSKPVDPLLPPLPPPGEFGAALPPKPPVAPGSGDEFDPAGYNRDLPKK